MWGYINTVEIILKNSWHVFAYAVHNYRPHALITNTDVDDREDRETDRQTEGHISSNVPHWGFMEPSVGIKKYI